MNSDRNKLTKPILKRAPLGSSIIMQDGSVIRRRLDIRCDNRCNENNNELKEEILQKKSKNMNLRVNPMFNRFSKWVWYNSRFLRRKKVKSRRSIHLKRNQFPSIKRKNFSSEQELANSQKQGQFLFHRGFSFKRPKNSFKKCNTIQLRYKNKKELCTLLDCFQLDKEPLESMLPFNRIVMYKLDRPIWKSLAKIRPQVLSEYITLSDYKNTTMKPLKSKIKVSFPRRSKTFHERKRSHHEKLYPDLYNIWKDYIKLVIYQRVKLRVSYFISNSSNVDFIDNSKRPVLFQNDSILDPLLETSLGSISTKEDELLEHLSKLEDDVASLLSADSGIGVDKFRIVV